MKKSLLFRLLLVVTAFSVLSCSDDDNMHDVPDPTMLNMLNEANGRTILGNSDVYINKANNFKTNSCLIATLGETKGIGADVSPRVGDGLVQETAVLPNHLYQVFDRETLRDFPSGKRAVMLGPSYYQVYIKSVITKEDETIGALVQFAPLYPDPQGLPEYGSTIGEVRSGGDVVEKQFPSDAEFYYPDVDGIEVTTAGGKLTVTVYYWDRNDQDNYPIYIRRGNVYTQVLVKMM